jgi:hypothetical protein
MDVLCGNHFECQIAQWGKLALLFRDGGCRKHALNDDKLINDLWGFILICQNSFYGRNNILYF